MDCLLLDGRKRGACIEALGLRPRTRLKTRRPLCLWMDLNHRLRLRGPEFYPLNYRDMTRVGILAYLWASLPACLTYREYYAICGLSSSILTEFPCQRKIRARRRVTVRNHVGEFVLGPLDLLAVRTVVDVLC